MFSIFAIDPRVCQSLEWFRYCVEHCHTSKGRAIADLPPKEWCSEALRIIDQCVGERKLGAIKGQSLKRRLERARDRLVDRPGTDWDYLQPSWVKNAEREALPRAVRRRGESRVRRSGSRGAEVPSRRAGRVRGRLEYAG